MRSAGSLCGCGVCFSQGVDVRALLFIPWSAGVWGLSTLKVMGLILLKLNPCHSVQKTLNVKMNLFYWHVGAYCHLHYYLHFPGDGVDLVTRCLCDLVSISLLQIIAIGR